jgi:DNA-binding MarR family transcriptional regulator
VRPLIVRRVITRSSAAVLKRRWREQQRKWGDRELSDMTETQIWWLVRILVTLLNNRDHRAPRATHARALARRLDWSQGALMPRLQRLESLGWVTSNMEIREIKGRRCQVQSYAITGAGEAVAVVMAPYLQELCAIEPREHRKL